MTFSKYNAPSLPLSHKLKLRNINKWFFAACFTFKLINKSVPPYFSSFYIQNSNSHQHNTRKAKQLHQKYNRTIVIFLQETS